MSTMHHLALEETRATCKLGIMRVVDVVVICRDCSVTRSCRRLRSNFARFHVSPAATFP